MQHGISNAYRARVWEYDGHWWVSIETPDVVGGWYRVGLGVGHESWPKWLSETYDISAIKCGSEAEARAKAAQLLGQIRSSHDHAEGPRLAAETAEIITA